MTNQRTVETPVPEWRIAATARPVREPEPPTNLSLMALDYIRDRADVARVLATTQELPAVRP